LFRIYRSLDSKYSLAAMLLTQPFKKRFHFHFYGDRHTNNIEKVGEMIPYHEELER